MLRRGVEGGVDQLDHGAEELRGAGVLGVGHQRQQEGGHPGAGRARLEGAVLRIGRLAVAPDVQGLGIGSRLLAAVEAHHRPSVRTAELFTAHLIVANLAMYARRGYRAHRREPMPDGVVLIHGARAFPGRDRDGGGVLETDP